jgi:phenylpropionate dioxygenase-like ring-hydroxylating dioxygenase large terminal subunit
MFCMGSSEKSHTHLPWASYVDADWLRAEKTYFRSSWNLLCHRNELSSGDYLVRPGWGGTLRAQLFEDRVVVEFKAEGIDAPFVSFPDDKLRVFQGLIFYCLGSAKFPIEESLSPFSAELAGALIEDVQPISAEHKIVIEANWKLVVEISLDETHVEMVHPEYAHLMSGATGYVSHKDVRRWHQALSLNTHNNWIGNIYLAILSLLRGTRKGHRWSYFWIFPGLELEIYPEQIIYYQIIPTSPTTTLKLSRRLGRRSMHPLIHVLRQLNRRIQDTIDKQDIDCVLMRQSILRSKNMAPQTYSEGDGLVRKFQQIILEAVENKMD